MEITKIGPYALHTHIGHGYSGEIYIASKEGSLRPYAIKCIALTNYDSTKIKQAVAEYKAGSELHHENILSLLDCIETKHHIYFVYEYCELYSIDKYIKLQPNQIIPEATAIVWLRKLIDCLKYLHNKNVIHRDIKPENILLTKCLGDIVPKLSDFGFSKILENAYLPLSDIKVNSQCYTPHYAAPEIQNDKSYNVQVDIYALGATFYYMLFGRCPFTGNNITELDTSKNKGDVAFDMTKTAISKASVDFICQCLKLIAYRPHLADLLEHPTINTRYEILAKDSFPKGEIKWINVHAYATIYS